MQNKVELSLIISFYKRLDFLSLIFSGLAKQSYKNFEVIISEDDDSPETVKFVEKQREKNSFPIQHISQPDTGFNKSAALNKAIMKAKSDFIVFIDGDCVPHKHLVKEYSIHKETGYALLGRRVMVSKMLTDYLIKKDSINYLNLLSLALTGSKRIEEGIYLPKKKYNEKYRGICGCNWGVHKKHLLDINGFDEDYIHATVAEDTDIEWRLKSKDVKLKKMKNRAFVYHLYHDSNYSSGHQAANFKMLDKKMSEGHIVCKNGIQKF